YDERLADPVGRSDISCERATWHDSRHVPLDVHRYVGDALRRSAAGRAMARRSSQRHSWATLARLRLLIRWYMAAISVLEWMIGKLDPKRIERRRREERRRDEE